MPNREDQRDILGRFITVQRHVPGLAVRDDELAQLGFTGATDQWMGGQDLHPIDDDIDGRHRRARGFTDEEFGQAFEIRQRPPRIHHLSHRLRLGTGLMREINVIYIRWPELSLQPLRQRYTNMGNELYKYENLESGYSALLSMDRDGLVMDYPGMWKRVYPVDPRAQPRD